MAKLLNRVLNFVGWEDEGEDLMSEDTTAEEDFRTSFYQTKERKQHGKVVNIHSNSQFKVVVVQPEKFEDAQIISDHLKDMKPIVVNLENLEKDCSQRIIDFLGGSVYALDGNIQKVATGIYLIAPNNVDVMGDFKDDFKNKGVFPWAK